MPILRNMGNSREISLPHRGVSNFFAVNGDFSALYWVYSRDSIDNILLSIAVDTGNADNFPSSDLKAHAVDDILMGFAAFHDEVLDL